MGNFRRTLLALFLILSAVGVAVAAQSGSSRMISGVVVGPKGEVLKGATIVVRGGSYDASTISDGLGQFSIVAPPTDLTLHIEGRYIKPKNCIL